jgi:hypothetical protein
MGVGMASIWGAIGKGAAEGLRDAIPIVAGTMARAESAAKEVTLGFVNVSKEDLYFCLYYPANGQSIGWKFLQSGENTGTVVPIRRRESETFYVHARTSDGGFTWTGDFAFHAGFPLQGDLRQEDGRAVNRFTIRGATGSNPVIIANESENVGRPRKVMGIRLAFSEDFTFRFTD